MLPKKDCQYPAGCLQAIMGLQTEIEMFWLFRAARSSSRGRNESTSASMEAAAAAAAAPLPLLRPASPSGRRVAALVQNLEVASPTGRGRAPSPGPRASLEHTTRSAMNAGNRIPSLAVDQRSIFAPDESAWMPLLKDSGEERDSAVLPDSGRKYSECFILLLYASNIFGACLQYRSSTHIVEIAKNLRGKPYACSCLLN